MAEAVSAVVLDTLEVLGMLLRHECDPVRARAWAADMIDLGRATPSVTTLYVDVAGCYPTERIELVRAALREIGVEQNAWSDADFGALLIAYAHVSREIGNARLDLAFLGKVAQLAAHETEGMFPLYLLDWALDDIASGMFWSTHLTEMKETNWEAVARQECADWLAEVEPLVAPIRAGVEDALSCPR